nr:MAG TPA: minor structural protein [Caudoviricetes sp.]
MKRKFLEDLGIETDAIEKIMIDSGKDTTALKAKIDELTEQLNVKDTIISEKNNKIAELEKVDVEAIKKSEYERGKTEGSKEIEDFKKQNALDKALLNYKAKDASILSKMLDMEKVKYNDKFEIVEGLEEQINSIKESHDYLFDSDKPLPTFSGPTQGPQGKPISGDPEKMDYNTYKQWRKQNN